jgi:hypothetical protein
MYTTAHRNSPATATIDRMITGQNQPGRGFAGGYIGYPEKPA